MTPAEFKSWFEGFTEAMSTTPTKAQWARIKERVAEIDGKAVTERTFIDRYWPQYIYSTPPWRPLYGTSVSSARTAALPQNSFNSNTAMYSLGKADAQSLTA